MVTVPSTFTMGVFSVLVVEVFEFHIESRCSSCACVICLRISQALCGQDQYLIVGNQVLWGSRGGLSWVPLGLDAKGVWL